MAGTTPVLFVRSSLFLLCKSCFKCARIVWLTGDFYGIIIIILRNCLLLIIHRYVNFFLFLFLRRYIVKKLIEGFVKKKGN